MSDNIVVELAVSLGNEAKKEISDIFKKYKLVHHRFTGKLVFNINQGGITNVGRADDVK